MMNNASHLRLPLFLWNFVVFPPGSGVTLWSAMIETNRLVLLIREAPVVPTDSARTDRIRNALTAWLCRAVSRALTWFAAVYRWVILPSGISSDCRCPLDVVGRKLCVKWKMNILVTFCINFATRSASHHSLFEVWNVRKICQQSQRTRACRTSRHKLAHCEGLATFGNSKLYGINHCMCPCMHQTLL